MDSTSIKHPFASQGKRTYVGFGFGAIQGGLFLYEAFRSGDFARMVVAEVMPDVVEAVRSNGGMYSVNIAHSDRVEQTIVGPIEILNPAVESERAQIIAAIADADEIGTAVPSIKQYVSDGAGSLHRILAAGTAQKIARDGPRTVIYAAENHNHAAEILQARVQTELAARENSALPQNVQFLNTVIGKMSRVVTDTREITTYALAPVTPHASRAFLVEAFNRILISQIQFDAPFTRGIQVFQEKENLLPFEEAKLYGHNATHALAAYLGQMCGIQFISDLQSIPGIVPFLRAAFIEESGEALIRLYRGMDTLFTRGGYTAYADDLLTRMLNPYLRDTIERVARDSQRKLGWNDRLIGTMRVAMAQNITPTRYALGAAAAIETFAGTQSDNEVQDILTALWHDAQPDTREVESITMLIQRARQKLDRWRAAGFPDLEYFQ